MTGAYSLPMGSDLTRELAGLLVRDSVPLSDVAVVFGGKRPALYLRRRLAEAVGGPFYPPRVYSMAEFVDHLARRKWAERSDLETGDAIWLLYRSVQELPAFKGHPFRKKGFGDFYYWGWYLLAFLDQLDAECVADARLLSVEKSAEIGYDVPPSVNELLGHICALRGHFHRTLEAGGFFTRGSKYLAAMESAREGGGIDQKQVYFAGLFGLGGAEKEIVKAYLKKGDACLLLEGEPQNWPVLNDLLNHLGAEAERLPCGAPREPLIRIHSSPDLHGEVLKVREILSGQGQAGMNGAAVVLPAAEALFPLLNHAVEELDVAYNISLGYPFKRTPVYDFLAGILSAQTMRRNGGLTPSQEYLGVILHPFVKNLRLDEEMETRQVVLDVERRITGGKGDEFGARPFVTLEELERSCDPRSLQILRQVHDMFFRGFEEIRNLSGLVGHIRSMADFVLLHTPIRSYVLSGEIFRHLFDELDRIGSMMLCEETFNEDPEENRRALCDFMLDHLGEVTLPFDTAPLEELEIIGMLESRNLAFDRVVVLDVNEGIIPHPRKVDPLVPLGIYEKLGLPSPEQTEEIFHYHFSRLVKSAGEVHLLYREAEDLPRSRYIEQILWEREKKERRILAGAVERSAYRINLSPSETAPSIPKTGSVVDILRRFTFSPSAIDEYIACPLRFYYTYIMHFEPPRGTSRDIDALERGTIIHGILHDTFAGFLGKPVDSRVYEECLHRMRIAVEHRFQGMVTTGEYYLFKRLTEYKMTAYLKGLLKDAEHPFTIRCLEEEFKGVLPVGGSDVPIRGRIDRVDYLDDEGMYLLIDYKTGGVRQYPRNAVLETDVSSVEEIHRNIATVQLPLYIRLFAGSFGVDHEDIGAKLVLLRNNSEETLFPARSTPEEKGRILDRYLDVAKTVLGDLLNPERPFAAHDDDRCGECAFRGLCHV
jgi:ATP-dependent helicase/nuclease subunit B